MTSIFLTLALVKEDITALQKANTALCNKVIDLEQKLKELEKQKG